MKTIISSCYGMILVTLLLLCWSPANANIRSYFGEKPNLKKAEKLDDLIKKFNAVENKLILVEGVVRRVCKKKGCWMVLQDKKYAVRVTFKNYSFFVPQKLINTSVLVQGRLIRKHYSVAEQKHYLEDEEASQERIDSVKTPKVSWQLIATGLESIPSSH